MESIKIVLTGTPVNRSPYQTGYYDCPYTITIIQVFVFAINRPQSIICTLQMASTLEIVLVYFKMVDGVKQTILSPVMVAVGKLKTLMVSVNTVPSLQPLIVVPTSFTVEAAQRKTHKDITTFFVIWRNHKTI
jgi:hypothetical protein